MFGIAPEGWHRNRLRYCASGVKNGAWGAEPGDAEHDSICVRVADFDWDHLRVDLSNPTIRSFQELQFQKLLLRSGDILLEKSGGGEKTPVGRVVRFENDIEAVTSNFLARVRPSINICPEYFIYLLAAFYHSRYAHQFIKQNTGIQNLDDSALFSSELWQPAFTTQKLIAEFLDRETARIDHLIERKKRQIALLDSKKTSHSTELVTRGLDPTVALAQTGIEWLPYAPSHWRVCRLATIFREVDEDGEEGLPVLSVSINWGISDRELGDEDRHRIVNQIADKLTYKRVRPGDLAYNMMRAWQGAFGVATVDGLVSPAYVVARPKEAIHSPYFEPLLRTPMCIEEFRRASKGIADFRQRLYWEHFRQVRVVLPPLHEQQDIAKRIHENSVAIDKLIVPINTSIERLQELRSTLIIAAVTGQIDVATWGKSRSIERHSDAIEREIAVNKNSTRRART